MIQKETRLKVIDNSGATEVLMIGAPGHSKKKSFKVGDIIKITVKHATPHTKVKKGEIYFALIMKTKYPINRKSGHMISFDENAVILLHPSGKTGGMPIGTSIFGDIPREILKCGLESNITRKIVTMVAGGGLL